jgi:hypothetical protein
VRTVMTILPAVERIVVVMFENRSLAHMGCAR